MRLNARAGLLHRQLFLQLRQDIVSGRYGPGDRLPTQEALCERYAVSRITVRRALGDLQNEGLVRNEQGAGAFVTDRAHAAPAARPLGFLGEMHRVLDETTMRVLSIERARCPASIAAALRLHEGDEALHLLRVRSRDGVPLMLLDAWIPPRCAGAVTARALRGTPLYQLVSGGAEHLGRVVQEVTAALADPGVAHALGIDVNDPVLRLDRLMHDRGDSPIMHMTIWVTPRRTRLVSEVQADALNTSSAGRLLHDAAARKPPRSPSPRAPRTPARRSRA